MSSDPHHRKVVGQFGPNAAAYLTSAVHAAGADLDRMAEIVGRRPCPRALVRAYFGRDRGPRRFVAGGSARRGR
ncbi:hypothetical protein [Propionivibrio dicarboxylicus]|uniref:Uncharacterized protein n=1 Tax=Propionivibrio dicarboxylicus TaxID=83767 RepID=A0A1G8GXA6_9RHOO|nr:hypothetical protein [Propionivibrio dicarboxylicus]SDH99028.1 hypothetical protein SAMN05660652_02667 [Propionivibrio dicarboxylicus]